MVVLRIINKALAAAFTLYKRGTLILAISNKPERVFLGGRYIVL